eukprot:a343836_39.p1 GENE.a343836_39~~a343836_39.p1  ORF type:complete len:612 (+),score=203.34 a343836_39:197-1837(+)
MAAVCVAGATPTSMLIPLGVNVFSCFFGCNASVLWPGPCGCPNNCGAISNLGTCVTSTGSCKCAPNYGGPDCTTLVSCGANARVACSGHGNCVQGPAIATCACDSGFTGTTCSAPLANWLTTPAFPPMFPNEPVYYADPYGDGNPLFNTSVIATIRIQMSPQDYEYLLVPSSAYDQDDVRANMSFTNGLISFDLSVGVRLKGAYSRRFFKKGFKIAFDAFVPGQAVAGQPELGLKGCSDDPTAMRGILAMDLARSIGAPVQRFGFSQLWINDVFMGYHLIIEEVTEVWVASRLPPTPKPALVKCHKAFFIYKGPYSSELYPKENYDVVVGSRKETFERGLIPLMLAANESHSAPWIAGVGARMNLTRYLRNMAIETLLGNPDSYTMRGNNWYFYQDNSVEPPFGVALPYDQEESFGEGGGLSMEQWAALPPALFFNCALLGHSVDLDCGPHPLSQRAFALLELEFAALLIEFTKTVFQPLVPGRVAGYATVFEPLIAGDPWVGLDLPTNATYFATVAVPKLLDYVALRAAQPLPPNWIEDRASGRS